MADSSLAITGGNVDTRTASNGDHRQVMVVADSATDNITLVNSENELYVRRRPADLCVTALSSAAAAVTATLPAVAGKFHYICGVGIELFSNAARTGAAGLWAVTTTNLPGSPAWAFGTAGAIGTVERTSESWDAPLKSSTVNTATTFVCGAATGGIWRIRVYYYTSL